MNRTARRPSLLRPIVDHKHILEDRSEKLAKRFVVWMHEIIVPILLTLESQGEHVREPFVMLLRARVGTPLEAFDSANLPFQIAKGSDHLSDLFGFGRRLELEGNHVKQFGRPGWFVRRQGRQRRTREKSNKQYWGFHFIVCSQVNLKNPKSKAQSPRFKVQGPRSKVQSPESIQSPESKVNWLTLDGANRNNLKNLTVNFPLGRLVLVTGVSGSGKSTLIRECLLPALTVALKSRKAEHGTRNTEHGTRITGFDSIKSVYEVDQSPIGRTPRSVPATYVGFFDDIRQLLAQVPEARLRGYSPSRFSFNSSQGRCPECEGAGTIKLEMNFLPPAFVRCEVCGGTRFNRETLDIEYHGKTIAQVLEMSVEEGLAFFTSHPKIKRALQAIADTGLGYLKLGQTSPTLSGGEAQRVKLVSHLLTGLKEPDLFDRAPKRNLFILEEPTIGLHIADVQRLVEVLQRLVDAGHSVIVIEHNLDLIAEADWVIDLGPEGGDGGGRIVAEGTPEQIARNKRSHTGRFLRSVLHLAQRS